ncbi:MAG: hypothetical protein A2275_13530 [Bacteroidetes bacterium RIFOXYA12_FULL_35_11]|nr:MAG: hypothetical protein A2X01_05645 [Bacteroidetes bacterium GWF2_35_48]OFY72779.1 MAG: hypothetical protein A2275_13530 [Bacteroidetes bacterium RIFOXYA12_FULL_35_11]OFY95369.1 MAG: hypothetical protein A2491_12445 [Bacteroidetes bacterium RIFOXYC12_FULL_35_7]HBX52239.1 hypothetical protein [Bacteroidales bacterium]
MKKLSSLLLVAGTLAFVACGPSAEELEKKRQDSIATADSIAAVEAEVQAAKEKAIQDSIAAVAEKAQADSIAAAEAKGKKKK